MSEPHPDSFHRQVDRILANRPVDTRELSQEDISLLDIARTASQVDFSNSAKNRMVLREHLELRARRMAAPAYSHWTNWAGALLAVMLLFIFTSNTLLLQPHPTMPAPAVTSPHPGSPHLVLINHPEQSPRPQVAPRPVPTPLAPPNTTPSQPTPGGLTPPATP